MEGKMQERICYQLTDLNTHKYYKILKTISKHAACVDRAMDLA